MTQGIHSLQAESHSMTLLFHWMRNDMKVESAQFGLRTFHIRDINVLSFPQSIGIDR